MSWLHRYGHTRLRNGRIDNLSINWDYDYNPDKRFPVVLFTPDMENTKTHYHIKLDLTAVRRLYDWLGNYLRYRGYKAHGDARIAYLERKLADCQALLVEVETERDHLMENMPAQVKAHIDTTTPLWKKDFYPNIKGRKK